MHISNSMRVFQFALLRPSTTLSNSDTARERAFIHNYLTITATLNSGSSLPKPILVYLLQLRKLNEAGKQE